MNHAFPRTRDEWLEPPDDNGSSDKIADYISSNYISLEGGIYWDIDNSELVRIEEDEFYLDGEGEVVPATTSPDSEQVWELAVSLVQEHIANRSSQC
jgi:hypothetical protein